MRQWLLSVREFARALWKGWVYVVIVVLCGAVGFLQYMVDSHVLPPVVRTHLILPAWGWYLASVVGLLVGSFIAFHRLRMERDALRAGATQGAVASGPSRDQVRRWKEFIQPYTVGAGTLGPLGPLNLIYEPDYVEMRPHLAQDTNDRIEHLMGVNLSGTGLDLGGEIKQLILRDLTVLERAAKADDWGDDDGYFQVPERLR